MGNNLVMTRREYIGDIAGQAAAALQGSSSGLAISPNGFPWAKNFEALYESYVFEACTFEYVPQASTATTGYVLYAPDFDPADTHTVGKADFLNMAYAAAGPAWAPLQIVLPKAELNRRKTLYCGAGSASPDPADRLKYAGRLWIETGGQAGTTANMGEIWVTYTIRFMTPQLTNTKSGAMEEGDAAIFTGDDNAAPFVLAGGSLPATVASSGTTTSLTTFTFTGPFSGYLTYRLEGTDLNSLTPGGTATTTVVQAAIDVNTTLTGMHFVDADQGETYTISISNTTISAASLVVVRGPSV
jgi:hypothetical protein